MKLSWLIRTYRESDLYGHLSPIKTTSMDFKYQSLYPFSGPIITVAVYCATIFPSRYTANPRRSLFRIIPPNHSRRLYSNQIPASSRTIIGSRIQRGLSCSQSPLASGFTFLLGQLAPHRTSSTWNPSARSTGLVSLVPRRRGSASSWGISTISLSPKSC